MSNYKKLGDYIQTVNVRNTDLSVDTLLGITITKEFIPSVANTIGTDMSKYKVIKKNQFACSLMQVSRDNRIPIALLKDYDKAIISQAYTLFEVIDETVLLPEYLMMWFSRTEFDRQASFFAVGGVRGSLDWDDFLELELPIPSIEKQREIVNEYNTVVNRIKLNEQLNQKLEETAQALYKHWFVDFEFPNENGQSYKSSGGKMVYNDELDKEVPLGWEVSRIADFVKLTQGQVINAKTNHLITEQGIPLLRIQDLKSGEEHIFLSDEVPKTKIAYPNDIIVSRTGLVGLTFRGRYGVVHNNCFMIKTVSNKIITDYLFYFLRSDDMYKLMKNTASGSVQDDLSHKKFNELGIIIPSVEIQKKTVLILNKLENYVKLNNKQNQQLIELKGLLLAKMGG